MMVKKKKIDKEQKDILLKFWKKIENYIIENGDKLMPKVYPSIIFYYTYVNIFEEQF